MRLLPRSLAGQLIVVTAAATALTQTLIISGLFLFQESEFDRIEEQYFFQKILDTAEYLNSSPSDGQARILEASSDDEIHYSTSASPRGSQPMDKEQASEAFLQHLGSLTVLVDEQPLNILDIPWVLFGDAAATCIISEYGKPGTQDCPFQTISVRLDNGSWLNVRTFSGTDVSIFLLPFTLSLLTSLIGIGGSVSVLARRITRPLRRLSEASEQLGRGETVQPIDATGPAEVSGTAEAFNRMQERLTRYVRDRTAMLAAINHDLRTPITSLRLRAEFIEDDELRENIIETAEEMRTMVDSYLAFSRQEAEEGEPQLIDLTAMLHELAGEEQRAAIIRSVPSIARCHPVSLKRVFRNLISNAVKYGSRVRIAVECGEDQITVDFIDDGPGIPQNMQEEVFTPFTRLDSSRDVTDGSVGLGLSIARSIARKHGGDVFPHPQGEEFAMRVVLPRAKPPAGLAG